VVVVQARDELVTEAVNTLHQGKAMGVQTL
jgi:hypothetical protein